MAEVRPPFLADRDRCAQIHRLVLERHWAHLAPPVEEPRLPRLQRPGQAPVVGQTDVVGNGGIDIDQAGHLILALDRRPGASRYRSAPAGLAIRPRSVVGTPSSAMP